MLYLIIPILLLYLLWLFCVHMDEKELSDCQTKALPQKELHEPFQSESDQKKKGVLPVREFYYRFRRSDDEEECDQNLEKKRKPEEPPHDHQEDQQDPPPALRERRRPLSRPREDEEEDEDKDDQSTQTEASPVQDSSAQTDRVITTGTQEEWRHDEDVVDILIVKKDGETQTTLLQEDKGVEARPELKDEAIQISPVKESLTTQTIPQIRDIGTGEWLSFQRRIGVGNHIETKEKGLGEDLKAEDRAIQANPTQEDKSVQEVREHFSIGVETDKKEMRNQSLQILPSLQDKDIQKDISMADKSVQEQRKSLALSSIVKKENMPSDGEDSLSLEYSPSPLKRRASSSPSFDSEEGILKQMPTITSHYLPSSSGIEFEDSLVQAEPMSKPPLPRRRIGSMESIESIYPSHSQFPSKMEESEVIFSGFHKQPSLIVSEFIEEEKKESQNIISFQTSSKKEESEEFEVIKKSVVSRHSSFSVVDEERD